MSLACANRHERQRRAADAAHTSRSYRYPYALVASHSEPVGVDIERIEPFDQAFLESILTPSERRAGVSDADPDRLAGVVVVKQGGTLEGARRRRPLRPATARLTHVLARRTLGALAGRVTTGAVRPCRLAVLAIGLYRRTVLVATTERVCGVESLPDGRRCRRLGRSIGTTERGPMFNTIVWATDGSEDAIRALPYAKALATGEKALLVVVHIVHEPGSADAEHGSVVDGGQGQADFPANVRDLLGDLSQQGLNAILKAVDFVGPQPAQGIADIAAEVDADVIVVGTRGHSAIGGLLVGQRHPAAAACRAVPRPRCPTAARARSRCAPTGQRAACRGLRFSLAERAGR